MVSTITTAIPAAIAMAGSIVKVTGAVIVPAIAEPSHPNSLRTISRIKHAQMSACVAWFMFGATVGEVLPGAAFGTVLLGA